MKDSSIDIRFLAKLIDESNYTVVVLGGRFSEDLGYTIPSPYHRSLWSKVGDYLTINGFKKNLSKSWSFYKGLYEKALELDQNRDYRSIIDLLERGYLQAVITSSIDGVLSKKNSLNIVELAGNIRRSRCLRGEHVFSTQKVIEEEIYRCPIDGEPVRPDIIFYGEHVGEREWIRAIVEISSAELVIIAGLDPVISPYNKLPLVAQMYGVRSVFIDSSIKWFESLSGVHIEYSPSRIWSKLVRLLL